MLRTYEMKSKIFILFTALLISAGCVPLTTPEGEGIPGMSVHPGPFVPSTPEGIPVYPGPFALSSCFCQAVSSPPAVLLFPPAKVVNVRSYRADPNDSIDDTDAIQRAVDAAPLGGTVFFPKGEYIITVKKPLKTSDVAIGITLKSNISLFLSGVTLRMKGTCQPKYAIFYIDKKTDVNIYGDLNTQLIGDWDRDNKKKKKYKHIVRPNKNPGQQGMGVLIRSSERVKVWNVSAKEFWGDGFCIDDGFPSRDIEFCGVQANCNRRHGLTISSADGVRVINSTFKNNNSREAARGSGIRIETGPIFAPPIRNVLVYGCTFKGNILGLDLNAAMDPTYISSNIVQCNKEHGMHLSDVKGITVIEANKVTDNRKNGIFLENSSGVNLVGDNYVERNKEHGISLDKSDNNYMVDNFVRNNEKHGIFLDDSNDVTLGIYGHPNTVENNKEYGISLVKSHNNKIDYNLVQYNRSLPLPRDQKRGISLFCSTKNTVSNNTAAHHTEWSVFDSDKSCTQNTWQGNDIRPPALKSPNCLK